MIEEKTHLTRKEKRAIWKLKKNYFYHLTMGCIFFIFRPTRKFITLPFQAFQKLFAIISLTTYTIYWKKIWYVDDFIIHKKLRWRWYAQKLFSETEKRAREENCDVLFLTSRSDRKASHKFYKKAWFTLFAVWVWVIAYKKMKK